jgi:hypothetical protein
VLLLPREGQRGPDHDDRRHDAALLAALEEAETVRQPECGELLEMLRREWERDTLPWASGEIP